jgi:hypothetical protein
VRSIETLAGRIGELRATEVAIFETLGAWAMDPESAAADRVAFAAAAHRAAWRAEQLQARAPVLASLPPDEMLVLGDDPLGTASITLASLAPDERTAGMATIVALLADAYAQALADVAPTDAPSARLFARLSHDVGLHD